LTRVEHFAARESRSEFPLFKTILSYLDELATAIQNDISTANDKLDSDECRQYLNHSFFK